jgi:hypothetical protein
MHNQNHMGGGIRPIGGIRGMALTAFGGAMTGDGYSRIILRPAYTLNVTLIDELLSRTGSCYRKELNAFESFQLPGSLVWKSSFCVCV